MRWEWTYLLGLLGVVLLSYEALAQQAEKQIFPTQKVGGRLMLDYNSGGIAGGGFTTTIGVRRLRVYIKGKVAPAMDYKVQVELAKSRVRFKDLYLRWKVPAIGGFLYFGNQLDPISLVQNTSSKYRLFMEGPFFVDNFYKRNIGIGYYVPRMVFVPAISIQLAYLYTHSAGIGRSLRPRIYTAKLGYTRRSPSQSKVWYTGFGTRLVHKPYESDQEIGFTVTPSSYFSNFGATYTFANWESILNYNIEQLFLYKRFGIQAEWSPIWVYRSNRSRARWDMFYAQVDFMLTDDRRNFADARKGFGKVRPTKPLDWSKKQYGAFQIALRYNGMRRFFKANEWTAAINWYPYSHLRVMYNVGVFYFQTSVNDEQKTVFYHQLRFQMEM